MVKNNKARKENIHKGGSDLIMYITKTTKKVYELFDIYDELDDINRVEICIILFEEWSNKLINELDEINPSATDEDYEIFSPTILGLNENVGHLISELLFATMNNSLKEKKQIIDDNYLSLNIEEESKKWISKFEQLSYIEKIEVIEELIIRYDNETMIEAFNNFPKIHNTLNGYQIAASIDNYKNKISKKDISKFPYEVVD